MTLRRTHVVPTHLRTPELVVSVGGISLSAKQFLLLLIGAALSYDLWLHLSRLWGGIALLCALFPVSCAVFLAFLKIAGRELPTWVLVLVLYQMRTKRFVWRRLSYQEPGNAFSPLEREDDRYH